MHKVETAVTEVFGPLNIREDITMERLSELTLIVRKKVEGSTDAERKSMRWLQYLMPPREEEEFVLKQSGMDVEEHSSGSPIGATPLRRLLDETSDLIDSPPFAHVLTLLLDAGFSTLVDQKLAKEAFKVAVPPTELSSTSPRVTEVVEAKPVKLPIILATMTRQAHSIGNGVPNEYLEAMEQVRDLEAFAAVVYSSNWENEIGPIGDSESSTTGEHLSTAATGEESIVDVGSASAFDKAWGKAVETVEKGTVA
jgi:peroxin-3